MSGIGEIRSSLRMQSTDAISNLRVRPGTALPPVLRLRLERKRAVAPSSQWSRPWATHPKDAPERAANRPCPPSPEIYIKKPRSATWLRRPDAGVGVLTGCRCMCAGGLRTQSAGRRRAPPGPGRRVHVCWRVASSKLCWRVASSKRREAAASLPMQELAESLCNPKMTEFALIPPLANND